MEPLLWKVAIKRRWIYNVWMFVSFCVIANRLKRLIYIYLALLWFTNTHNWADAELIIRANFPHHIQFVM